MLRPRSLLSRLMIPFLTLIIIGIAASSYISWHQASRMIEKVVYAQLKAAAALKTTEVKQWVERQKKQVVLISQLPDVRILCEDLAPNESSSIFVGAQDYLRVLLESVLSSASGLSEIFILSDADGEILVSTNPENEKQSLIGATYYEMGRHSEYTQNLYMPHGAICPTMTISAPIRDTRGDTLAVLAAHLNFNRMQEVVMNSTSLPSGGEIYMVDKKHGLMSLGSDGKVLADACTEGIDKALSGLNGSGAYLNYAGRRVMGVYVWIKELEVALLAEIGEREGLAQARSIAGTVLLTGFASACFMALAVYFLSLKFVRPVKAITTAAQAAAKGDLTQKVEVKSQDEIGILAENFNSMISQLRALYAAMEVKIDQIQQANDMIAAREKRFRALIENASDIITVMNANAIITYQSPSVKRILGYDPSDMIGQSVFDWFHPDDADRLKQVLPTMLEQSGVLQVAEYRVQHKDGTWRTLELLVNNLLHDPVVAGFILNIRDVTERREAERALEAEKERLAVTLRSIGDGVVATNADGMIMLFNEEAQRLTGWSAAAALGRPAGEALHVHRANGKGVNHHPDPVGQVLLTGRAESSRGDIVIVSKDRGRIHISSSAAPITDEDGAVMGAVLILRDVTQRRKYETELQKIEKLESVGVLAGGIAHDFNNILTGILGNISLSRLYAKGNKKILAKLEDAEKASLTARALTQQLLTFARGGAPVRESASLAELLKECVGFVMSGSKVRCEYDVPDNLLPAEVDAAQIRQVIQNLVINAVQAMPKGGSIRINAKNVEVDRHSGLPLASGKYVEMSVTDQGEGIPAKNVPNIFDPYFTTKQEGSGLGLATTYSIVKKHEGHISVASHHDKGTTFTVHLPASRGFPEPRRKQSGQLGKSQGRVLLMDDEQIVRDVTGEILKYMGFSVDTAFDGAEALAMYKQAMLDKNPYLVVIMDLTIPGGMGGKKAIKKLLEIDPDAKAIVSSGYSQDPIMSDYTQYGFSSVIAKPFMPENLLRVIKKAAGQDEK